MNCKSLLFFFFVGFNVFYTQTFDSVSVIPNKKYEAGYFYRVLFGNQWRQLWTNPIKVPILDIKTYKGGLKPFVSEFGFKSVNIKFIDSSGVVWKFRSVDKDAVKILPERLQNSFVDGLFDDLTSSSNPYSVIIASELSKPLELPHSNPELFFLPNSDTLNYTYTDGILGTLEFCFEDNLTIDYKCSRADSLLKSYELLKRLSKYPYENVNAKELLKTRYLDLIMCDWDKFTDQWIWEKDSNYSEDVWLPIPIDRDNSFSLYDGLFSRAGTQFVKGMTSFSENLDDLERIIFSGRVIDRRFLTRLNKIEWYEIAEDVKTKLTDKVIMDAVSVIQGDNLAETRNKLYNSIRNRRDGLTKIIEDYYYSICNVAEIFASDIDDYCKVDRIDDKYTTVSLYNKNDFKLPDTNPYFYKKFENEVTEEIRIFLGEGNDSVSVSGIVDESSLIRVVGGNGKDSFVDSSIVNGLFMGLLPVSSAKNKTRFYDSDKNSFVIEGRGTVIYNSEYPTPKNDEEKYEILKKEWGNELSFIPNLNYTSENRLIIGGGIKLEQYDFRMIPLRNSFTFAGSYVSKPRGYNFFSEGVFNNWISGHSVILQSEITKMYKFNFYGFGNNSEFSKDLYKAEYYRTLLEQYSLLIKVKFKVTDNFSFEPEIKVSSSTLTLNNHELVKTFPYQLYGTQSFSLLNFNSTFKYDSRENNFFPESGFLLNLNLEYNPVVFNNESDFYIIKSEFEYISTFQLFSKNIFSLFGRAEKLYGKKYPFFKSVFLGGIFGLIGYKDNRFAGDASLMWGASIKTYLGKFNLIIPSDIGAEIIIETGKVYVSGWEDDSWKQSYGVGLWGSILNKRISAEVILGFSDEDFGFLFNLDMGLFTN